MRVSRAGSRWGMSATALVTVMVVGLARNAAAGCGCQKPPPPVAEVRPNVTYAGAPVTLFSASLVEGEDYDVTFTSSATGDDTTVSARVVNRRDLGDGVFKNQLVVPVPELPLGPAAIVARLAGRTSPAINIQDADFTVAPAPVAVPSQYGEWRVPGYRAAVGKDGVVYVTLDLTGTTEPLVFEARALGYPLRFTNQDIIFRNAQGFLMQLLVGVDGEPVPGMFIVPASDPSSSDSDTLRYSRHEFSTYFLQHAERQPHAVDPTDPNWHLDGSRHVDHNHLILAIAGQLGHQRPDPGTTPAFDLGVTTYSLFHQGLVGVSSVTMSGRALTDGYDTAGSPPTPDGDVFSNGMVSVHDHAKIEGDATGAGFDVARDAAVSGSRTIGTPLSFMEIKVPAGIPDLGKLTVEPGSPEVADRAPHRSKGGKGTKRSGGPKGRRQRTLVGPGSFLVSDLTIAGRSTLFVDNSAGPVTLYVTGRVTVKGTGRIVVADPNPEKFAVYVASDQPVTFGGSAATRFYGVLYAPRSTVDIMGGGQWYGAFVGNALRAAGRSNVHYYRALKGR